MTQDADLKTVRKTGRSKNMKQSAIGYDYIHTMANGGQLTVWHTAGVHRELRDKFITSWNGKAPWSTKAFLSTFHEINYHDVLSSGIFAHKFCDQCPQQLNNQALITLDEAT